MINYIIGGAIFILTALIVFQYVKGLRNGKSICSCENCDSSCCNYCNKKEI